MNDRWNSAGDQILIVTGIVIAIILMITFLSGCGGEQDYLRCVDDCIDVCPNGQINACIDSCEEECR